MEPAARQETIPVVVSSQTAASFRSLPKGKRKEIEAILGKTLEAALSSADFKASRLRHGKESLGLGLQSALLSESTLSRIWESPEEDEAWRDL